MRRSLALALLLVLTSLACARAVDPGDVLRVGVSGDYAPFSLDGRGFDIDVATRMAADLELRLEWVPFRWPDLRAAVAAGVFDVAMSGVTWRPERAVFGWMTRAVAAGGPCVLGDPRGARVAVNRGGILERWARANLAEAEIRVVDDNTRLPLLLERGEVDAIVTDSFERMHFTRPGWPASCEPPRDRKVYWVAPGRARDLGPRIDSWIAANEPELARLRARWMGAEARRDGIDHLIDLIARRLAFMPSVARWKRAHGLAIEDPARESVVLRQVAVEATALGLDVAGVREVLRIQIELAKAIQRRSRYGSERQEVPDLREAALLDLHTEIRPALLRLGGRITRTLARVAPIPEEALTPTRLAPLGELLVEHEIDALRVALLGVQREL